MNFDWWLRGICFGRALSQTVTMVYAAALPVLQREWEMSAAKAGAISSGYQIGYAVSPLVISSLADKIGARFLFIASTMSGAALTTACLMAQDAQGLNAAGMGVCKPRPAGIRSNLGSPPTEKRPVLSAGYREVNVLTDVSR
jgi:MFS family permease